MSLTKPMSSIPTDAATYPPLAHFFPCNETSGRSVTCAITGLSLSAASGEITNSNGVITLPAAANVLSGAWTPPNGKHVMIITLHKATSGVSAVRLGTAPTIAATNPVAINVLAGGNDGAGAANDGTYNWTSSGGVGGSTFAGTYVKNAGAVTSAAIVTAGNSLYTVMPNIALASGAGATANAVLAASYQGSISNTSNCLFQQISKATSIAGSMVSSGTVGATVSEPALGNSAAAIKITSMKFGAGGGIASYLYDGTTFTTYAAACDMTSIPSPTTLGAAGWFSVALNPAMVAVLYYNTLPTAAQIQAAAKWMYGMTFDDSRHLKLLHPGLLSLS
jgi:hypothetical protein